MLAEHGAVSGKLFVTVLGTQSVVAVKVSTPQGERRENQACLVGWRIKDEIHGGCRSPMEHLCSSPATPIRGPLLHWFSGEAP